MIKKSRHTFITRIVLTISVILLIIFGISRVIRQNTKTRELVENEKNANLNKNLDKFLKVDFEGNGKLKYLDLQSFDKTYKVFDHSGKEVKILDALPRSLSNYKAVKLNTKNNKEYIQWESNIGPHHTYTFFYTLYKGGLQAMPYFDKDNNIYSFAFYNSRNELGVGDFTSDGLLEIVEHVDEYPPDAPRLDDPEIEKIVRETFNKDGNSEDEVKNMIKIVERENYGKGRGGVVVWSIYSFVESDFPFFRKLGSDEYNEIADRYIIAMNQAFEKANIDSRLMKISNLSKDSIDFNNFVRDIWSHGVSYEFPIGNSNSFLE